MIKDEKTLVRMCENMDVYIYGAGMVGGLVISYLRKQYNTFNDKFQIKGIVVSKYIDDIIFQNGLNVYEIDAIAEELKASNILILICTIEKKQEDIINCLKKKNINQFQCLGDECIRNLLQRRGEDNEAVFSKLKELENMLVKMIPKPMISMAYHLTDVCNLNCKGCWHFAPLATALNREQRADCGEFEEDVKKLAELLNGGELIRFTLMGGEPLMHREAYKFPYVVRKYFPKISIEFMTNGILIPEQPEEFWVSCRENDVLIQWTQYPVLKNNKICEIEKKLIEENIRYEIFCGAESKYLNHMVIDISARGDDGRKDANDARWQWAHCWRAGECVQLRNHKIYPCCDAADADLFKTYFHLDMELSEDDGLDIYKVKNKDEIYKFLAKPIPFCRYCNVQKATNGHKWSQSEKKIEEWT